MKILGSLGIIIKPAPIFQVLNSAKSEVPQSPEGLDKVSGPPIRIRLFCLLPGGHHHAPLHPDAWCTARERSDRSFQPLLCHMSSYLTCKMRVTAILRQQGGGWTSALGPWLLLQFILLAWLAFLPLCQSHLPITGKKLPSDSSAPLCS